MGWITFLKQLQQQQTSRSSVTRLIILQYNQKEIREQFSLDFSMSLFLKLVDNIKIASQYYSQYNIQYVNFIIYWKKLDRNNIDKFFQL
ncbi:hypothetical protein pb186bvf_015563 [Paramecium bursaria]